MKNAVIISLLLFVTISAQNSQNITLLGEYSGNSCTAVAVSGNYAFLTESDNYSSYGKIKILDISDPSNITEAGSYYSSDEFQPVSVAVEGNHLFVGSSVPDLRILDISNISAPQVISRYEEYCLDIQLDGNIAFLAAQTEGLITLNISNLSGPSEIGYFEPDGDALAVFVKDNYAYLAYGPYGLRIADISKLDDPVQAGYFDTPDYCWDVFVKDNYIFIADHFNGLLILDGSNLSSLTQVAQVKWENSSLEKVIVENNFAYLADPFFGVRILDISNISSPVEVGYYKINGGSYNIYIDGNRIYSVNSNGLTVLQNDLLTDIKDEKPVANQFELYQNYPNPFNPSTTIKYSIPQIPSREGKERSDRGVMVTLKVYDVLGREVATLVNEKQSQGNYEVTFNASSLPSGIYFYKLTAGSFTDVKKMILMK